MIKVLELFAGIGACSSALDRLGIEHEIVDAVEIDKHAMKSFNAIHGTNFWTQDITTWNKDIQVDLIMHGSPCQDFSVAGLQAGGDEGSGTRSSLMYETIRIVSKLKPKYVVWENVKNLLSKKHRHNFDNYLKAMEDLGYKNFYQVLNAKDYGIPQNRERVFTVSILNGNDYKFPIGNKCENEIKVAGNYMPSNHDASRIVDINGIAPTVKENHGTVTAIAEFEFPQKQELKLRLKDILEDEVEEKYYLSNEKIKTIASWGGFQNPFEKVQGNNSIVPTLTARGAGNEHNGMITYSSDLDDTENMRLEILSGAYARKFGSRGKIQEKEVCDTLVASMGTGGGNVPILKIKNATKQGYCEAHEGDSINLSYPNSETRRGRVGNQVAQTLQCSDGMGVIIGENQKEIKNFPSIMQKCGDRGTNNYSVSDLSYTIPANPMSDRGQLLVDKVKKELRIRKLTPKECWRLMRLYR